MLGPHVHRVLSRAALAAMLLLATLPTLGRLVAAPSPMAMPSAMAQHAAGHAMPPAQERTGQRRPPAHQHAEDCAYCALLSGAIATTVPAPPAVRGPAPGLAPGRSAPFLPASASPGLGARGPPPIRG